MNIVLEAPRGAPLPARNHDVDAPLWQRRRHASGRDASIGVASTGDQREQDELQTPLGYLRRALRRRPPGGTRRFQCCRSGLKDAPNAYV